MTRLPAAHRTLADLEREARNARESEMRLIHEASLARETGTVMPEAFWKAFGNAFTTARLAERAVAKAKEGRK